MKKQIILCAVMVLLISTLMCGCFAFQPTETHAYGAPNVNNSNIISKAPPSKPPEASSAPVSSTAQSSSSVSSAANSPASEPVVPDVQQQYDHNPRFLELEQQISRTAGGMFCLSEAEAAFTDKSLFVGDSICRGFTAYNVVKAKSVFAAGSVGARNFFDMEFHYYGQPTEYAEALEQCKPEYIFLSMGMNDVNISTAQQYCENYRKIIDFTLEHSNAKVYICAITPINSTFTEHSRIDAFNLAMKNYVAENLGQRVGFVDFAYLLKDSDNNLSAGLDSGDGIHLAPECYYIALLEICNQLGIT